MFPSLALELDGDILAQQKDRPTEGGSYGATHQPGSQLVEAAEQKLRRNFALASGSASKRLCPAVNHFQCIVFARHSSFRGKCITTSDLHESSLVVPQNCQHSQVCW